MRTDTNCELLWDNAASDLENLITVQNQEVADD